MTRKEKEEEEWRRLKEQLRRRVRKHRPAAKVLEMTIALAEERIEGVEEHVEEEKRRLVMLKDLDPKEIEQEDKS